MAKHITDKRIGIRLAKLRLRQAMRQTELAERLGTSQSIVSKIEAGRRSLRIRELRDYAQALGMDPKELVDCLLSDEDPVADEHESEETTGPDDRNVE